MGTVTLSQVLSLHRTVKLYGRRISDLAPRGDLGLGLDPAGPLGFAAVRAAACDQDRFDLTEPIVLSVFGEGEPPEDSDAIALPGERIWTMAMGDRGLKLQIVQGTLWSLLGAPTDRGCPSHPNP